MSAGLQGRALVALGQNVRSQHYTLLCKAQRVKELRERQSNSEEYMTLRPEFDSNRTINT